MWQKKVTGILGIWIIALVFINFSQSLQDIFLVLTGLLIIFVSFFGKKFIREADETQHEETEESTD